MSTPAIYEERKSFTYSDFDIDDHLLISHAAQCFQDVAGNHSEILGCGYEAMKAKDAIWVLVRAKFDLLNNPRVGEPLTLKTCVQRPRGLIFERQLIVEDASSHKIMLRSISNWVLASLSSRRMIRPFPDVYPADLPQVELWETELLKSLTLPDQKPDASFDQRVHFVDLDHNRHMNNCRYFDLITNIVVPGGGKRISTVEIDFEKECVLGETLRVERISLDEDSGYVAAYDTEDEKLIFKSRYRLSQGCDTSAPGPKANAVLPL